mmetsp:Transcript_27392/g.57850  ORF Transcript_27392/g.57850 Transcript_27392/m.57850 type:complete len:377 (+) Transcript_27392:112-1242(+)
MCFNAEASLSLLPHIVQQKTTAAQSPSLVSKLGEELDIVKISRNIIGTLVKHKVLSIVLRHIHGVRSSNSPDLIVTSPCHIGNTISARLDVGLIEGEFLAVQVHRAGADQELSTVERHPQSILNVSTDESHVLDTTGRTTVVWDPKVLTGLPCEEEVTTGRDGEVGAHVVALFVDDGSSEVRGTGHSRGGNSVKSGINCLLDLRLPISASVFSGVHGTTGGDHFSLVGSQGQNSRGLTGELRAEGDALPALSAVLRVKEQGRLTEDPSLTIFEAYHLETVGDFLLGIEVGEGAGLPCLTTVVGFGERSASAHNVSVGGGVEINVIDSVLEGDLNLTPLLGGCGRGRKGNGSRGGKDSSGSGGGCLCDEGTTIFLAV